VRNVRVNTAMHACRMGVVEKKGKSSTAVAEPGQWGVTCGGMSIAMTELEF
jgi:hypothetical protein